jgi:hypothetical protein
LVEYGFLVVFVKFVQPLAYINTKAGRGKGTISSIHNMVLETDVLSLNPDMNNLLKNKNKLQSTHVPHLHPIVLHMREVLKV